MATVPESSTGEIEQGQDQIHRSLYGSGAGWGKLDLSRDYFIGKLPGSRVDIEGGTITVGLNGGDFAVVDYPSGEAAVQAAIDSLPNGGTIALLDRVHCQSTGVRLGDYIELRGEIAWADGATITDDGAGNPLVTAGLFCNVSRLRCYGNGSYRCPLPVANDGSMVDTYTPAYEFASAYSNTLGSGVRVAHPRTTLDGLWVEGFAEKGIIMSGSSSPPLSVRAVNVDIIGCGQIGLHCVAHGTDGKWANLWIGSCGTGLVVAAGNGENSFVNAHLWGSEHNNAELAATYTRFHGQVETAGEKGILITGNGCSIVSGSSVWGNGRSGQSAGIDFASVSACAIGLCEVRDNNGDQIRLSGTTRNVRGLAVEMTDRLAAFESSGAPQTYSDGAGTAASHIFTTAAAPFDPVIHKSIIIAGAGSAGGTLTTTITAVNPGVSVTLADPIVTTVSGATFRFAAATYGIRETDTATGNLFLGCSIPTNEVIVARTALSSGSFEWDFTSAPSARAGLAVPSYTRSTFSDADVTINSQQQYVVQTGTLSAPRLANLPAISAVPPGWPVEVADESATCGVTNTISLVPNGTDRIKDGASVLTAYVLNGPCKSVRLRAGGGGRWIVVGAH